MYRNSEHYADPTAGAAFAHIAYEERKQRRLAAQKKKKAAEAVAAIWKKEKAKQRRKSVPSSARLITVRQHGFWHGQSLWFQSKLVMEGMNDTDSY